MKKLLKSIVLGSVLTMSISANAGVGLSIGAISNMAKGEFGAAAIGGGLGAGSIVLGLNRLNSGRIGWGVFFLILAENNMITSQDAAILSDLDVSVKEALAEILASDEASEIKEQKMNELFDSI